MKKKMAIALGMSVSLLCVGCSFEELTDESTKMVNESSAEVKDDAELQNLLNQAKQSLDEGKLPDNIGVDVATANDVLGNLNEVDSKKVISALEKTLTDVSDSDDVKTAIKKATTLLENWSDDTSVENVVNSLEGVLLSGNTDKRVANATSGAFDFIRNLFGFGSSNETDSAVAEDGSIESSTSTDSEGSSLEESEGVSKEANNE